MNDLSPAGLTQAEAAARLAVEGYNDLPQARRSSPLAVVREVVREPMFVMLLGAGALYAVIGDLGEAVMLLLFATISVSIAIIQRGRSERVLEALRELTSPRALVVRDGEQRRIPGRDVVRGDLLVLGEGDRIAADARLVAGTDVRVSESLLTGESVPVHKYIAAEPSAQLAPDMADPSLLYGGTLLVGGGGLAQVMATGARSAVGRLGLSMRDIRPEVPRLQSQTRRLVVTFAIVGATLSVLAVLLYGLLRGDWVEALLGGIALGMSMLPEEFPLVLTVFMVMGAWRLSRARVLTRRAAAIETLGAATVLCTDKTGTLTCNSMSVVRLEAAGESWREGEDSTAIGRSATLSQLLQTAVLASEVHGHDPMDRALGGMALLAPAQSVAAERVRVYPLRRELLAVTHVWEEAGSHGLHVTAKGAPEAIAALCRLGAAERAAMMQRVDALAREGIRVLAVAQGTVPRTTLPDDAATLSLHFTGLVGFADPLRESVPAAVRECREAGIRVVMITGDYPHTAQAIARAAGLAQGRCLTGAELDALSDEALARLVRDVTVFARIAPLQKLRIVNALKAGGEIVAMTGDGVNDAVALQAAHIGIAMGGRGTDVAREAAALVLLDDDFGSMVRAIRHGRRIYDNLRKAMSYILAVHVPIAGMALLPVLGGAPLMLTPMLIALLELIIDPTCSIVLEAEPAEPDVMSRPPRDPRAPLVSRGLAAWAVLQGALAFAAVAAVYLQAMQRGLAEEQVRLSAFIALVSANVALLLANRGFGASFGAVLGRLNVSLWLGVGGPIAVLTVLVIWPTARQFLGIGAPSIAALAGGVAAGAILLVVLQLIKTVRGLLGASTRRSATP